ncbi:hypothetical protein [Sandaracinus amylolyticus]|uniref:hypothetical protein n=1 Tax=Sandaracinus amylolyticus TaxID=927083 RepID=UPI001F327CD8|nr:hypothetical protein [Sandaracinus amylolyticus]
MRAIAGDLAIEVVDDQLLSAAVRHRRATDFARDAVPREAGQELHVGLEHHTPEPLPRRARPGVERPREPAARSRAIERVELADLEIERDHARPVLPAFLLLAEDHEPDHRAPFVVRQLEQLAGEQLRRTRALLRRAQLERAHHRVVRARRAARRAAIERRDDLREPWLTPDGAGEALRDAIERVAVRIERRAHRRRAGPLRCRTSPRDEAS